MGYGQAYDDEYRFDDRAGFGVVLGVDGGLPLTTFPRQLPSPVAPTSPTYRPPTTTAPVAPIGKSGVTQVPLPPPVMMPTTGPVSAQSVVGLPGATVPASGGGISLTVDTGAGGGGPASSDGGSILSSPVVLVGLLALGLLALKKSRGTARY
jgi:hypothetical protein